MVIGYSPGLFALQHCDIVESTALPYIYASGRHFYSKWLPLHYVPGIQTHEFDALPAALQEGALRGQ